MAEIVGIPLNDFGFYDCDPASPLDTARPGVFLCGCAHSPMDIPESVAQASSAAARAAQVLTGSGSQTMRIVVKDTRDYERLLREKLYKIKGIRHSQSSFVLRTLKKADLPLGV